MASAPQRSQPRMSVALFRQFVEGRPDEEHWELIDGVAMMMAPPTIAHQIITTNLLLLLHAALQRSTPTLRACPAIGVNVGPAIEDYDPEPDVVVIDAVVAATPGERYAARFYLAAEIVSSNERVDVDRKRAIYKLHETCKCIVTIEQDRFEVRIDRRSAAGWTEQTLSGPDDLVVLDEFGLRCKVSDLYGGTPVGTGRQQ